MLDEAQLRAAWQLHQTSSVHDEWRAAYRKHLEAIANASRAELATPEWQERLWKDKSITTIGAGEYIDVSALYADPQVVDAILNLREMKLPSDVDLRAQKIQATYNALLALVASRNVRVKPAAKLKRIFAGLIPREVTCVVSYGPNVRAAKLLLGGSQERGHLHLQVLMREKLRSVLGPEAGGLEEDVLRSTFCWSLYENAESASAARQEAQATLSPQAQPPDSTTLVLWPFAKQWKGNAAIKGFDRYYRDIVQASVGGSPRDEIIVSMRGDETYAHLQPQSIRQQVTLVKGLGLLEERDGLLRPSPSGEELLEAEEPDLLVRIFIECIFGYAQLLRFLDESPRAVPTVDLVQALQSMYPNWTSTRAPVALLAWADALGLADKSSDGEWTLSEYGRGWAARLPADLPSPPTETITALELDVAEQSMPSAVGFPSFAAIVAQMGRDPKCASFVFDRTLLAALDSGWRLSEQKRFVILSGLSGTGKTAITSCYARAVCALMGIELEKHCAVVPVSPDWRDPTSLFGYFNALGTDPTYQPEVTLQLLLHAHADPTRPYFLVLDEMNLARVERYFAPMLSAMETGNALDLHANAGPVNGVPPKLSWPKNLYIAGTVNMDESTHPFSDKVLDRAVTLEFWQVDLPSFFEKRPNEQRDADVEGLLVEIHGILAPIRRHFGYRTAGEVVDFVARMRAAGEQSGIDLAVFGKILPRLRGEHTQGLENALSGIEKICATRDLSRSRTKLESMLADLRQTGMTRFWA